MLIFSEMLINFLLSPLNSRRHKVNLRVLEQRLNKIQEESTTTTTTTANNKSDDNKEDEEEEEEGEVEDDLENGDLSDDPSTLPEDEPNFVPNQVTRELLQIFIYTAINSVFMGLPPIFRWLVKL